MASRLFGQVCLHDHRTEVKNTAALPMGLMRITSVPLTKVSLRDFWTKPGSLVMVSVEMGPT